MASRATVKEAIELLKIHQIRRENAAIYQQIKELREEVSDLHDANDETWKKLDQTLTGFESCRKLSTQHSGQIIKLDAGLDLLTRNGEAIRSQIKSARECCNAKGDALQKQNDLTDATIKQLECEQKTERQERVVAEKNLSSELDAVRLQLAEKIDSARVEAIAARLDDVEFATKKSGVRRDSADSTSCVFESVEHERQPMCEKSELHTFRHEQSPYDGRTSTTQRLDSDFVFTLVPRHRSAEPSVPDDLDLDEETATPSNRDVTTNQCHSNDSFIMLPYQLDEEDSVDQVLGLKQLSQESLAAFLERGYALIEKLPRQSEPVAVRRLVENLYHERHRGSFSKWLNATSWSWSNLNDAASLHGISGCDLAQSPIIGRNVKASSRVQQSPPCILVAATESAEQTPMLPPAETVKKKKQSKPPLPPPLSLRRSQRLVAKSQANTEVLDANISACATGQQGPTATVEQTEQTGKNKSMPDVMRPTTSTHTLNTKDKVAPPMKRKRSTKKVPDRRTSFSNQLNIAQDETTSEGIETFNLPKTPTRQIFRGMSLHQPPQKLRFQSVSPFLGQLETPHAAQHPRLIGLNYIGDQLSPYRPRPRLVSAQHRPTTPRTITDRTSDPDVILPQAVRPAPSRAMDPSERIDAPARKKRRTQESYHLPLKPILSTSTEEDRRFDRW